MTTPLDELYKQTINENNHGLDSLADKFEYTKPIKSQIESTIRYVSNFPDYLDDYISALGFLSCQFARIGATFDYDEYLDKPAMYPKSGIICSSCNRESGIIYIFVNEALVNTICKADKITDEEIKQLTEDIYSVLIHKMHCRHQLSDEPIDIDFDVTERLKWLEENDNQEE